MSEPKSVLKDEVVDGFWLEASLENEVPVFIFRLVDEDGTVGGAALTRSHVERLVRTLDLALELLDSRDG